ncbi:hypothetical protein BDY19DRAFT_1060415 [Irpex rosettiformis]|uniref:Uncharacterized protein n=1 Tax=Irpex rosettiformis TaxID=378272 RepID=A0ACB8TQN3_9APHY|nr:hypothetical protein BDY19DRAFT_1060415 [Irpex rosettiformis]
MVDSDSIKLEFISPGFDILHLVSVRQIALSPFTRTSCFRRTPPSMKTWDSLRIVAHHPWSRHETSSSNVRSKRMLFYHHGTLGVCIEDIVCHGWPPDVQYVVDDDDSDPFFDLKSREDVIHLDLINAKGVRIWSSDSVPIPRTKHTYLAIGHLCEAACSSAVTAGIVHVSIRRRSGEGWELEQLMLEEFTWVELSTPT